MKDYRSILNPARIVYVQLKLNYSIIKSIEKKGGNIEDYPNLKKAAKNATRVALDVEIDDTLLSIDEITGFSNTLEEMLKRFPELC